MTTKQRVILLGLDGATFDLLLPRVHGGELPNLKRMLAEGAHGVLRSTLPPFTAPAWTSLASGKNPGKHGVVDFWLRTSPGEPKTPVSYNSIRTPLVWDYVNAAGHTVGLVDVPLTYPPPALDGFVVSGLQTPSRRVRYTSPSSLQAEVERVVPGYEPDPFEEIPALDFLRRTLGWIDKKERLVQYLFDRHPVDFFFNVVRAPDIIQHRYWDCLDRTHPQFDQRKADRYSELLERCYRRIDDVIGDRLGRLDERTTLLVVSDHGFGPARRYFHVNEFLRGLGLVACHNHAAGGVSKFLRYAGITSEAVALRLRKLDRLGVRSRLKNKTRMRFRSILDRRLVQSVDGEKTLAWSGGITGEFIYLNPEASESIRVSLIDALRELRDPSNGEAVFEHVYRREEAWPGSQAEGLPDIVLDVGSRPYILTERLGAGQMFQDLPVGDWVGRHRPDGILLALGSKIRGGQTLPPHDLTDIAPTILHLLGLRVPADMDGRVLFDLFEGDSYGSWVERQANAADIAIQHTDASVYSEDDVSQISQRLKALGYLD